MVYIVSTVLCQKSHRILIQSIKFYQDIADVRYYQSRDSSSNSSAPPLSYQRTSFSPRVRVLPSPDPNDRTIMPDTNHPLNIFIVFLSLK